MPDASPFSHADISQCRALKTTNILLLHSCEKGAWPASRRCCRGLHVDSQTYLRGNGAACKLAGSEEGNNSKSKFLCTPLD